ncbi:MAG: hypothetical protein KAT11_00240 [Phycisphaerae bacterium]|nr:hypothetical protein [Phycisphaerae bacterium]
MSSQQHNNPIPAEVKNKLRKVRRRMRLLAAMRGLIITVAVLLVSMLAVMLIDRFVSILDKRWRCLLTYTSLCLAGAAMIVWLLRPLFLRRGLSAVAMAVDNAVPSLEERWATVTELSQSTDPPEIKGSEMLINKVAEEAENMNHLVRPRSVVSPRQLRNGALVLAGAVAVLLLGLLASFEYTSVLLRRFWAPNSDISLTHVVALTGSSHVPRHEPITLEARLEGRTPRSARLFIRGEDGRENSLTLDVAPDSGLVRYSIKSVKESFRYRVRAGDTQTEWYTIEPIDRPSIAKVRFSVTPPDYSHLPAEQKDALPSRFRMLQGSRLQIDLLPTKPLASLELQFATDQSAPLTATPEQWYSYSTVLNKSTSFTVELTDHHGLKNLRPPRCRLLVYKDQPPVVEIISPERDIAVAPDETIPIEFRANDDFGIAEAELQVSINYADKDDQTFTIPIDLNDQMDPANIKGKTELDLSKLELKHGDQLSYTIKVADSRLATSSSSGSIGQSGQPDESQEALATADTNQSAQGTDAGTGQEADAQNQTTESDQAKAGSPSDQAKAGSPSGQPPNEMTKRSMPSQGCSSSQPSYIQIDEWAGSFEGQQREKLQIAIEAYIKRLDALLSAARKPAGELEEHVRSSLNWQEQEDHKLTESSAHLKEADDTIDELTDKSRNTPYAFMAMQLEDIGLSHVDPARENLVEAGRLINEADKQLQQLSEAVYQIDQAKAKLAGLTKRYKMAKRAEELGEAMQRVAKMHQIFIEDMFAFLKSKPPTLNPRTGEMLEVSDEYVKKLKENAERFKELLAELSKVLAEDPWLLRRFMAMGRLNAATLRDQATMLARRQKALYENLCEWCDADRKDLPTLLRKLLAAEVMEQLELAEQAAKLNDNMIVWLPRNVDSSNSLIADCREISTEVVLASRQLHREAAAKRIERSLGLSEELLEKLRELDGQLAETAHLGEDEPKLAVYLANRTVETIKLIDRQVGWAEKVKALRSGRYATVARIDQYRLMQDTLELGGKLESVEAVVSSISDEIAQKANELVVIINDEIPEQQFAAILALKDDDLDEGRQAEAQAVQLFAKAEKVFDELLTLIENLPAEAPTEPCPVPTLEDMLAMLENELKACEKLGAACKKLNVMTNLDWIMAGSGSGGGSGSGAAGTAQAQAKAAKALAQMAADYAKKWKRGELSAVDTSVPFDDQQWNILVSKLREEMLQERATNPPKRYRKAINGYFHGIAKWVSEKDTSP